MNNEHVELYAPITYDLNICTVPRSDPSLLSILSQHIIIPEVSVLFVESRSFFSHISALLLSNFVATDVYALSLKISKSLPAVFFPFLV